MRGRKLIAGALLAGMISSPMVMAEVLSDKDLGSVSAQGFQVAQQYQGAHEANINNDSVQLNDMSQTNAQGLAVTNSAGSAANVGQNVVGLTGGSGQGPVAQSNRQDAQSYEASTQQGAQADRDHRYAGTLRDVQNINNASAQLNHNSQEYVTGMAVTNAASSADNVGQNVVGVTNTLAATIAQSNVQAALQRSNNMQLGEQEDVDIYFRHGRDKDRQNVNNASTQLNNKAQRRAEGLAITNTAASAANVGQNIAGSDTSTVGNIAQRNDQYANNAGMNRQFGGQVDVVLQARQANRDKEVQSVNNASTQLNDKAQKNARGLAITNTAASAANVGQNIAGLTDSTTGSVGNIAQSNAQVAENSSYNVVRNAQLDSDNGRRNVDLDRQNANNGSTQLNNKAQRAVRGLAVTNAASSAVNVAQNVVGIEDSDGANVRQANDQYALDSSRNTQAANQAHNDRGPRDVHAGEVHANNGSAQLNDQAQENARGLALSNSAASALSVGQNILGMSNGYTGTIVQSNLQMSINQ